MCYNYSRNICPTTEPRGPASRVISPNGDLKMNHQLTEYSLNESATTAMRVAEVSAREFILHHMPDRSQGAENFGVGIKECQLYLSPIESRPTELLRAVKIIGVLFDPRGTICFSASTTLVKEVGKEDAQWSALACFIKIGNKGKVTAIFAKPYSPLPIVDKFIL